MKATERLASIQYEVLNPRGIAKPSKLTPLVDRVPDLNGRKVYVVNIARKVHAEEVLEAIAESLRERFPRAEVVHVLRKQMYWSDEPELWEEIAREAYAAVVGPGD